MNDLGGNPLAIFLIALAIGLILGFLLLRRRQKVTLTDSAPVRPYMSNTRDSAREGNDLASEAAAATSDVTGEIIGARVHDHLVNGPAGGDDFQRLKGVGPKLAAMLNDQGITRYEQLASMDDAQLAALDARLGTFKGRLARDRVPEQARYLASGDTAGFEATFGKLGS